MRAKYGTVAQHVAIKMSVGDKAKLTRLAKAHTNGNASTVLRALLRYATPEILNRAIVAQGMKANV